MYFKKKLELTGDFVVLAVGQFIKRKGFDLLLKAAAEHRFKNIQFILVGGEATKEYLQIIADKKICNCEFVKFKNKSEWQEYYLAADLFVHPTREDLWGLVINEAMAYGLPVITTTKCIAGLEMVYNNENGFLVPCNDLETLILTLENSLNDEMLKKYSRRSREIIMGYTVEKMAKRHFDILDEEAIKNRL